MSQRSSTDLCGGRPAMAVPTAIQENPGFGSVKIHATKLSKKEFKKYFESALANVHAAFGVLGFAGVVNARSLALEKQYRKMKWQLFVSYFTWPKAALTLCLFLLFSLPVKFLSGNELSWYTTILVTLLFVFQLYVWIQSFLQTKKQTYATFARS